MSMENIRNELKMWEKTFKEIYNRKPLKADIDVAPAKIRALYHEYTCLRKGIASAETIVKPNAAPICRVKRTGFTFNKPLHPVSSRSKSTIYNSASSQSKPSSSTNTSAEIMLPLCGINPKFNDQKSEEKENNQIGQKQFVSYYHSASPYEIALKRRNFCNLAMYNVDGVKEKVDNKEIDFLDDDNESNGETAKDEEGEDVDREINNRPLVTKKKRKAQRSNSNFVRLDMKNKRYQAKPLQRMKGAALKRFLFKQRTRQQRKC